MAQRKHLDNFLRGRIIERLECECTQLEVSEEFEIDQSVISRLWKRFQDDVTAQKKHTEHSIRPVSSALFCYQYGSLKADRVETLRTHWSICSFSLQSDSRRTLLWRAQGTCYHQENTIERHGYGGAGRLVWGGIILGSRTDLHVQSVTMTGHIQQDVILEQHVRLFRVVMGAEFLIMDDNARPHHANIVDKCFQSEDITCMDWPAYSPDLSPIKHVWDMLGGRIAACYPPLHLSTGTSEDIA
ncbi:transposable element Tcb1 transposase [Trichonephila clavipes]|nr:transposable element Tcb1 transposase [Trichonephila clavipes]